MDGKLNLEISPEAVAAVIEENRPRLTIILHPNPTCMEISLNDRMFNKEKYSFSRKRPAEGAEKKMLEMLEEEIIGIQKAETCKNVLKIEIHDGMRLKEFVPQVITAVKAWAETVEPYNPIIYLDNRRWAREPVYANDDDWTPVSEGRKQRPGSADIGMPYEIWQEGQ